jgi:hypothetical protein
MLVYRPGIHAFALTLLTAFTRLWDSPLDSDGDPDAVDYEEDSKEDI